MVEFERNTNSAANAADLEQELTWFARCLELRIAPDSGPLRDLPAPPHLDDSHYAKFVAHYELGIAERLIVVLALAPHLRPHLLDSFYRPNENIQRGFTQYGGIHGRQHGGFLPTGETALFLLANENLDLRLGYHALFDPGHFFAKHRILKLESAPPGEPFLAGQLVISDEIIDLLTQGEIRRPTFSNRFPATLLSTEREWEELVLDPSTLAQIDELEAWSRHEAALMLDWGLGRKLRPGYRCLFFGPPGTGKTLMATLLGKRIGCDVYRIALSAVVSKYIGETEKNLESIFQRAENLNCILFFDEADALFGKRTSVSDAHDRYANQEVSYLLQRIEEYAGIVILASNYSSNMDDAFLRRFQAVIHFPMPRLEERVRLWSNSFADCCDLDDEVNIEEIARRYELSGGSIMNIVRYASLMALEKKSTVISRIDLITGIRREMQKDGQAL